METSLNVSRNHDTPKYSKDKIVPGFVRIGTELNDSRISRDC
jgi:hypothetical protein